MLMVFLWRVQEKEAALNLTVDAFCRLVKQHANVAQLVTLYEHFSLLSNYLHLLYSYPLLFLSYQNLATVRLLLC